jgi:Restriction endonuclease
MASSTAPIEEIERLSPAEFQRMCAALLNRTYPNFRPVDGSGGDEGVDGWVPELEYYFQFHAPSRGLRKTKLRSYVERVAEHHPKKWFFITNRELTRTQWSWVDTLGVEFRFPIEVWGPTELFKRMDPGLRDYYLVPEGQAQVSVNIGTLQGRGNIAFAVGEKSQVIVKGGRKPKITVSIAGTVQQDADKHNYLEYLVRKYNKFKEAEVGKAQMKYALIRKRFEDELGFSVKYTKLDKFEAACRWLQRRIDNSCVGRRNQAKGQRSYDSFEDFCAKPDRSSSG